MIYISKVIIDKKGVLGVSHLPETLEVAGSSKAILLKANFNNKIILLYCRLSFSCVRYISYSLS